MYPCNIYQADLDVNKLRMSSDTDILLQDFATKAVITAENLGLLTTFVMMLFFSNLRMRKCVNKFLPYRVFIVILGSN